jgi:hypothetical protein
MAHGDLIESGRAPGAGAFYATHLLLDDASEPCQGPWLDVRGFKAMTVDVSGLTFGTVILLASNAKTAPKDGHQLGESITSDGLIVLNMPLRWLRADVEAMRDSRLTVVLHAVA